MSPVGKEMHYKNGMKKDADGFVDIDWCSSAVLDSWDDLRRAFKAANERKAIAPTQVLRCICPSRQHCNFLFSRAVRVDQALGFSTTTRMIAREM